MLRVMKAELFKFNFLRYFIYPIIWPLFIVALVFMVKLTGVTTLFVETSVIDLSTAIGTLIPTTFPLLIAIMMSYYVNAEYKTKTVKNIICSGNSRKEIFVGKYLACLVSSAILLVVNVIILAVAGLIFGGVGELSALEMLNSFLFAFISMLIYATIFFTVSVLIKSDALSACVDIAIIEIAVLLAFARILPEDVIKYINLNKLTPTSDTWFITFAIWAVIAALMFFITFKWFKKKDF